MRVSDNSGARLVKCIRVLGGSTRTGRRTSATSSACAFGRWRQKKKLLRKSIYTGLIVGTKKHTRRLDGSYLRSDTNRCLILNKEGDKFLGTRVDGTIPRELRGGQNEVKYKEIISYSGATI